MNRTRLFISALTLALVACQSISDKDTIARLRHVQIEIKEEKVEGGLDKAMRSYQHFLEETPDSALAPEAIRRLADLKIEKEYGTLTEGAGPSECTDCTDRPATAGFSVPEQAPRLKDPLAGSSGRQTPPIPADDESEAEFEKRATESRPAPAAWPDESATAVDDLENPGALEAIALYTELLEKYPLYDRNDQVLYQMSRAYEELGRIEEAMQVMDRLVREFAQSRYIDEVQFRRAEYFFSHRHYLDAEEAYSTIVTIGVGSSYYELALFKLGWTFYKQELYEEALHRFIALLDYKVSVGLDFTQIEDDAERKRTEDTLRVISLSFSNLGGADSVVEYFSRYGQRPYEDSVYSNLAEFYFDKRRYADAAATYNAFVSRNPFHKAAPNFSMRVIEIHAAGGFPSLVLEAKKSFASTYGLQSEYWHHFEPESRPEVLGFLKTNLTDLANHYHACYQDPRQAEDKPANFKEALHWYRQFLGSFPKDDESPTINYHLADLLMENRSFGQAAVEYEKTAYGYAPHENAAKAGYAAVYAFREHLAAVAPEDRDAVKQEVVRSSLKFADTYPQHEKAPIVLGAAADDLYVMEEYERALDAAGKLLEIFPDTDVAVLRSAWLVTAHSSYELLRYSPAENAYLKVLSLLPADDPSRGELTDNLAASIYKQGEQANAAQDYRAAADHFLRVGRMAPTSKIRPNAEYDAATALIQLKDWKAAADLLVNFRNTFVGHELQPEVTKKIAYVYREDGRLSMAAAEYERIEQESGDDQIRQEALQVAGQLYEEDGDRIRALAVYRRYVDYFPQPVEINLETRNKIAEILKKQNDRKAYLEELGRIVAIDAAAGAQRTPRTRYLAAKAALVLAETQYEQFTAVKLEKPFEVNLRKKRDLMKTAVQAFTRLTDYEQGEVTAAATYYLAEIYAHFSKSLMTSERPEGLSPLELEQYELVIEEQAYPFEERAISVHESNLKLITMGVYNEWIEKSLQKLAVFMPARYDKPEDEGDIVGSMETYTYAIGSPTPPALPKDQLQVPVAEGAPLEETTSTTKDEPEQVGPGEKELPAPADVTEQTGPVEEALSAAENEPLQTVPVEETGSAAEIEPDQAGAVKETAPAPVDEPEQPGTDKQTVSAAENEPLQSVPVEETGSAAEIEPDQAGAVKETAPAPVDEPEQPGTDKQTVSAAENEPLQSVPVEETGSAIENEPARVEPMEENNSQTADKVSDHKDGQAGQGEAAVPAVQ